MKKPNKEIFRSSGFLRSICQIVILGCLALPGRNDMDASTLHPVNDYLTPSSRVSADPSDEPNQYFDKITLTVRVIGAEGNQGQVVLALFSSPENFLNEPVFEHKLAIDATGAAVFELDLESGVYAISVVYDANMDGVLNTGFLGIPKELVGFSNNARGVFGPPPFERASFQLIKPRTIEIVLGKAKD